MALRRLLAVGFLALSLPAAAPDGWLQVHSPHFLVTGNAGPDAERHVAGQLERMRAVFQQLFPRLPLDAAVPVEVLALKSQSDFRAVEPAAYLGSGKLEMAGYYQRGARRNYILLRLDAASDTHPFAVVYHEYVHQLTSSGSGWMPLWLSEGLAEFYETIEIGDGQVALGRADVSRLAILRAQPMIPLAELFAVDRHSSMYHEADRGNMFYAESWALVHYLLVHDHTLDPYRLADYMTLLSEHTDPTAAATQTFGDLTAFQAEIERYRRQPEWGFFRVSLDAQVNESAFQVEFITQDEADAIRADYMVQYGRYGDAAKLLRQVRIADPGNARASEVTAQLIAATTPVPESTPAPAVTPAPAATMTPAPATDQPAELARMSEMPVTEAGMDRVDRASNRPPPAGATLLSDDATGGGAVTFASGTIASARCTTRAEMDLQLNLGGGRTLALHAPDLGKVELLVYQDSPAAKALPVDQHLFGAGRHEGAGRVLGSVDAGVFAV